MAQLITASEIISIAFSNSNTDPYLFRDADIEYSQVRHLKPILGEDLYDEIVSQNDSSSLTALNTTLMDDYLINMLAHWSKWDMLQNYQKTESSKGIQILTQEFGRSVDSDEMVDHMTRIHRRAYILTKQMVDYIEHEDNYKNYPLYNSGENPFNDVKIVGGIIY